MPSLSETLLRNPYSETHWQEALLDAEFHRSADFDAPSSYSLAPPSQLARPRHSSERRVLSSPSSTSWSTSSSTIWTSTQVDAMVLHSSHDERYLSPASAQAIVDGGRSNDGHWQQQHHHLLVAEQQQQRLRHRQRMQRESEDRLGAMRIDQNAAPAAAHDVGPYATTSSRSATTRQIQPNASTSSSSNTASTSLPPDYQHKVYLLNCRSCGNFLTDRGMKAVLLLKPNIILFSTDATPFNCGPMPSSSTWDVERSANDASGGGSAATVTRTCDCLTQSLGCYGCGAPVGYTILSPCARCTSSVAKHQRSSNGHRNVFHYSDCVARERRYVPGEPGVRAVSPLVAAQAELVWAQRQHSHQHHHHSLPQQREREEQRQRLHMHQEAQHHADTSSRLHRLQRFPSPQREQAPSPAELESARGGARSGRRGSLRSLESVVEARQGGGTSGGGAEGELDKSFEGGAWSGDVDGVSMAEAAETQPRQEAGSRAAAAASTSHRHDPRRRGSSPATTTSSSLAYHQAHTPAPPRVSNDASGHHHSHHHSHHHHHHSYRGGRSGGHPSSSSVPPSSCATFTLGNAGGRVLRRGEQVYWNDLVSGGERPVPLDSDEMLAMPIAGR